MIMAPAWTVLVPMKSFAAAKSRLALAEDDRAALAAAMLSDVIEAALRTPSVVRVVVASADRAALDQAASSGAEPLLTAEGELNADLRAAITAVVQTSDVGGVAIVVADAACLHPDDLAAVFAAAPDDRQAFVRSLDEGTTILLARDPAMLDPRFGPDSAAAHSQSGADLTAYVSSAARVDVDTVATLGTALRLGPGARTTKWVQMHSGAPTMPSPS